MRLVEDDAPPRDVEQRADVAAFVELAGDCAKRGDHYVVRQERFLVQVLPCGAVVHHAPQVRLLVNLFFPLLRDDRGADDEGTRGRLVRTDAAESFAASAFSRVGRLRGSFLRHTRPAFGPLALLARRLASLETRALALGILVVAVAEGDRLRPLPLGVLDRLFASPFRELAVGAHARGQMR